MSLTCLLAILSLPAGSAPNDPDFDKQWALNNTGQLVNGSAGLPGADINALNAWAHHPGVRTVIVAIVGGGVNPHEEFAERLLPGHVSALAGGDPYSTLDIGNNGTRAAGLIAARRDNGIGIAGINDHAQILPVRVAKDVQVTGESVAEGLIWAADHGAEIALVLLQFVDFNQSLADAVSYAASQGVLVIAPAGHDGSNTVAYPAALGECLAVSATTTLDESASYSNFGPEVDLAAPGEWIWSTMANGGYGYEANGDSFTAAAQVAGVASLLRSYSPGISASAIRQILLETADDLGTPGDGDYFGAGRINAYQALVATPTPLLRFEPLTSIPIIVPPQSGTNFPVRIANGTGTLNPASPAIAYRTGPGAFTGTIPMQSQGGGVFSANLPALNCGSAIEFYLRASALSGPAVTDPTNAPNSFYKAIADPDFVIFEDDFEDDLGWESLSTGVHTTGAWVRDDPVGTRSNGVQVQPDYDRSEDAKEACFLTGQYTSGTAGSNDVDLGPVTLTSPIIDIAEHQEVEVRFASWLYSSVGTMDPLIMEFSRDGGSAWTTGATITPTSGWEFQTVELSAFPGVSGSALRVRFTIYDNPSDSLTEAAIDEFKIIARQCTVVPGDMNGDGAVNLRDMGILGNCLSGPLAVRSGNCVSTDTNNDLHVDLRDAQNLLVNFQDSD